MQTTIRLTPSYKQADSLILLIDDKGSLPKGVFSAQETDYIQKELKADKVAYTTFLNRLPFTIDLGTHLVVHAGLRPNVELYSQTSEDMTLIRTLGAHRESEEGTPWYHVYHGDKTVLFGHWPAPEPRRGKKAIGLDTGCVYGYNLTSYIIETDEFVSVKASRPYDPS